MDGNHRTALLTFVLSLASSHVLLRPTFCIYRAYLIISARDHPENQENMLFSTGISEVSEELFRYARKRVRPGTPTWGYVEEMAERVRAVVVRASVVEEVYDFMKVGSRWENGEERWFGREQQGEVWSGCTAELKRDIGLAHMAFVPAGREGAGIRRRVT